MNDKNKDDRITGLSDSLKQIIDFNKTIEEKLEHADYSNIDNLKAIIKMQNAQSNNILIYLSGLASFIEYLAEMVAKIPSIKGKELIDYINEINNEVNANTAAIKKIQEFLDDKLA